MRTMRGRWCRRHPSGALGPDVEVFPGPARLKLRMPEAMLPVADCGLRRRAARTGFEWTADCMLGATQ
eukprot:9188008-Alexandrium_andersonii.AAC.1